MENENLSIYNKYRPSCFGAVVGQNSVIKSLQLAVEEKKIPQAMIFAGPSGTGKNTLVYIIANEMQCEKSNIIEIDGSTFTGVDNIRELKEGLKYTSLGKNPLKFVIINECQKLSASSWDALLTIVEFPPKHVIFSFLTTDFNKIPKAIQTRCHTYTLKDVRVDDLIDLLEFVATEEKIELPKGSLELIAKESQGSPRQALVYLSQVRGCTSKDEIAEMLHTAIDSSEVIDLCRLLITKNPSWTEAQRILKNLKDMSGESVRIPVQNYFLAVILNSKSEEESFRLLRILDVFSKPCKQQTGIAEIVLGVGELILSQD